MLFYKFKQFVCVCLQSALGYKQTVCEHYIERKQTVVFYLVVSNWQFSLKKDSQINHVVDELAVVGIPYDITHRLLNISKEKLEDKVYYVFVIEDTKSQAVIVTNINVTIWYHSFFIFLSLFFVFFFILRMFFFSYNCCFYHQNILTIFIVLWQ